MIQRAPSKFLLLIVVAGLLTGILAGCGGGGGGGTGASNAPTVNLGGTGGGNGGPGGNSGPTFVGTSVCEGCHTAFPPANQFVAGDLVDRNNALTDFTQTSPTFYDSNANGSIATLYTSSPHFQPDAGSAADFVTCEGCHGSGAQHYGFGPIPHYMPGIAQCGGCHGSFPVQDVAHISITLFNQTRHGNPDSDPDQFFFQGGVGTGQATLFGAKEWSDAGGTVPVSINQHIEECSACHSPDTKAEHIAEDDVPNPPQVACASCHDPHRPAGVDGTRNFVAARGGSVGNEVEVDHEQNLNFKPQRVNNDPAGAQFGAKNLNSGTWIRPRLSYDYHVGGNVARTYVGYTQQAGLNSGDVLRLTAERLCASCHTQGKYQFGVSSGAGSNLTQVNTHQTDVFTQFESSFHADKTGTGIIPGGSSAWKSFSLISTSARHRPQYPYDMGGMPGQGGYNGYPDPADPTKVIGGAPLGPTPGFDGRINGGDENSYCYRCHHGIGSIDYQRGTVWDVALGDSDQNNGQFSHILWGDSTVTCITCHEPHQNGPDTSENVRQPRYLSYNGEFTTAAAPPGSTGANARGGVNKMMDLTAIPANVGNSIICLFCHQGRESGWSAWNKVRRQDILVNGVNEATAEQFWYSSLIPGNPASLPGNVPIPSNGTYKFGVVDDHYLAAGGLLFSRNSTEFKFDPFTGARLQYSDGVPAHEYGRPGIAGDCVGCHMDNTGNNKVGGHTWNMGDPQGNFPDNIAKCQQCHPGVDDFHNVPADGDYAGLGTNSTVFNQIGTLTAIPTNTDLANNGVYGTGVGGTGLFGLLNEALYDQGLDYQTSYPYFFNARNPTGAKVAFSGAMTPNLAAAIQNLAQLFKTGAPGEQAVYVHNAYYAAQILIDSIDHLPVFGKNDGPGHNTGAIANGRRPLVRPTGPPDDGLTVVNGVVVHPTMHDGRDYATLKP